MAAEYFWTLPSRCDERTSSSKARACTDWPRGPRSLPSWIHDVRPGHYESIDHLLHVARAAAVTGLAGTLVPFEPAGEDSWVLAAALAREVPALTLVTEFTAAFATPVYATKMSATFQRFSRARLAWKLVIDEDQAVAQSLGDWVEGADRYSRAKEFLEIAAGIWGASDFTYRGRFFEVEAGGLREPLAQLPRPKVFLSGISPEAIALSAAHGDLHIWDLGSWDDIGTLRASLNGLAAANGREVSHGLHLSVIARDTAAEAWSEARRRWSEAGAGDFDQFEALVGEPGTWSGFHRIGHRAATGLVGSYEEIASRLDEAERSGLASIFLEARPWIEEPYRFVEHVVPLFSGWESARREAS